MHEGMNIEQVTLESTIRNEQMTPANVWKYEQVTLESTLQNEQVSSANAWTYEHFTLLGPL